MPVTSFWCRLQIYLANAGIGLYDRCTTYRRQRKVLSWTKFLGFRSTHRVVRCVVLSVTAPFGSYGLHRGSHKPQPIRIFKFVEHWKKYRR